MPESSCQGKSLSIALEGGHLVRVTWYPPTIRARSNCWFKPFSRAKLLGRADQGDSFGAFCPGFRGRTLHGEGRGHDRQRLAARQSRARARPPRSLARSCLLPGYAHARCTPMLATTGSGARSANSVVAPSRSSRRVRRDTPGGGSRRGTPWPARCPGGHPDRAGSPRRVGRDARPGHSVQRCAQPPRPFEKVGLLGRVGRDAQRLLQERDGLVVRA